MDSDSGDEQGVNLDPGFYQKRFASDELRFTGIDLGSRGQRRGNYEYDEDSDQSDEDHFEGDGGNGMGMQLALRDMRDKEDWLVEKALERIRRAQALGKANVKLTQPELDALERKRKLAAGPQNPKSKKGGPSRSKKDDRRRSKGDRSSGGTPPLPLDSRRRGRSSAANEEFTMPYPMLPAEPYDPSTGALARAPLGYYGSPAVRPSGPPSRPRSRNPSSQSLRQQQQHTPPLPQYHHPYQQGRYFSVPEATHLARPTSSSRTPPLPRPLPDDPDWAPRAHSTSNLAPYPYDPAQYQAYAPPPAQLDPRYATRRNVSGPPDLYHPSMYRPPPDEIFIGPASDPMLVPQRSPQTDTSGEDRTTEDNEDEDDDNGVLVEVVERPTGHDTRSKSGGNGRGSRQRRGRR